MAAGDRGRRCGLNYKASFRPSEARAGTQGHALVCFYVGGRCRNGWKADLPVHLKDNDVGIEARHLGPVGKLGRREVRPLHELAAHNVVE